MAIQATILGNLGADARLVTLGQTQALEFSMGSTRLRPGKDNERITDWVDVLYFKTGLQQWLTKGRTIQVSGELETHTYQSRTGEVRVGFKVVADRIEFPSGQGQAQQAQTQQEQAQVQAPQQPPQPQPSYTAPQQNVGDSNLPF